MQELRDPEERVPSNKGKLDVVKLGDVTAMRARFEPGWRWSECVKPIAGTASCEVAHLMPRGLRPDGCPP